VIHLIKSIEQGDVQMAISGSIIIKVILAFILTTLAVLKGENIESYVKVHYFHKKSQPIIIKGENPIIIKHLEVNTK